MPEAESVAELMRHGPAKDAGSVWCGVVVPVLLGPQPNLRMNQVRAAQRSASSTPARPSAAPTAPSATTAQEWAARFDPPETALAGDHTPDPHDAPRASHSPPAKPSASPGRECWPRGTPGESDLRPVVLDGPSSPLVKTEIRSGHGNPAGHEGHYRIGEVRSAPRKPTVAAVVLQQQSEPQRRSVPLPRQQRPVLIQQRPELDQLVQVSRCRFHTLR